MAHCIFCRILAGDAPASFAYRDDVCAAFMDVRPINPGHLLIVPLVHGAHLADVDAATGAHLMTVAQQLAAAVRLSGVRCEGINIFLADGEVAGQEVFHVHLHVIPRFPGDGFGHRFPPGYGSIPPREVLDDTATKIAAALP